MSWFGCWVNFKVPNYNEKLRSSVTVQEFFFALFEFSLRNSNEAMQAHPLTTSGPAPFTVHAHHAAQTVIATTTR